MPPLVFLMATSGTVFAAESVWPEFYGKLNLSFQYANEGVGDFTEIKSHASRVGLKGSKEVTSEVTVFYLVEWQVDFPNLSDPGSIKPRNQYLGINGRFGEFYLGRNDTITRQLSLAIDTFNTLEADLNGLWKGENRVRDTLTYFSPEVKGLVIGLTYAKKGEPGAGNGTSVGVYYGDPKLKKSKFYAALTHDNDIEEYDIQRLVVAGKIDKWTLGAGWHQQEPSVGGESKSGATVNAQYSMGKWQFKTQYQTLEDDNSFTVGADYKLGDSTKLFAWYTDRAHEAKEDKRWLSVGVEHKF